LDENTALHELGELGGVRDNSSESPSMHDLWQLAKVIDELIVTLP